ncbi:ERCC4 domain-containing protein [Meloidogyne graminicola]|uniref:Crossover junction endonuclease MUS81 n=1 Tax=Meloidogyne graminicola TaxID=189291 RepID=A0A8T0A1U1_9BILA|nr:ERCC4 domain-containing protein [Meloidogyne graminicola]
MENKRTITGKRRVKVRLQFPEKLFYERILEEWRKNISDKNHAYVIRKALNNLKLFPLDVHGHGELKKIRGIGEDIATRLDTAWRRACEVLFSNNSPSIDQIKAIEPGQAFRLLEETASEANSFNRKRGNSLPFIQKRTKVSVSDINKVHTKEKTKSPQKRSPAKLLEINEFNYSPSKPTTSLNTINGGDIQENLYISSLNAPNENLPTENITEEQLLHYSPFENILSQIILIADIREETRTTTNGKGKSFKGGKGVGEFLLSSGIKWESRQLSVGDYLWILQWKDRQTGKIKELVLDYIIERKTWDDLKKSIREPRYLEQKSRLQKCGINNIVLIVEGSQNNSDRSLEQAMISTSVDNDFLVHRTLNKQGTAKFLQILTKRLEDKCAKEEIIGPSFENLQEKSKKPKPISISDCWLRQLTVCPGMSLEKARAIQQRFPTFLSLVQFFKDGKVLNQEIPTMGVSVTRILNYFLRNACNDVEFYV